MTIAKPGSWLAGYILGVDCINTLRKGGWATGKGKVKIQIRLWTNSYYPLRHDASNGFIDAVLDSVN